MDIKLKILLLIFLSCFLNSSLFAEVNHNKLSTDSDALEYTLPEVLVRGDNSMHALRKEVIRAEELKFEVFNNLNSTDDFDITCEWRAPTGTRIKYWRCDVEYMRKAREEALDTMMALDGAIYISEHQLAVQNAHKTRALNREMKALAARNPELAVAMINAHELQQFYREEARNRYKDSIFVGNPPEPDLKLNKITILEAAFQDHSRGIISDEIWARWDNMYRKLFRIKSYRKMWKSTRHNKYGDEFVAYVNTIMSGK